jgi:hypothetical protein
MALETSAKTAYNVNDLFVAIGNHLCTLFIWVLSSPFV